VSFTTRHAAFVMFLTQDFQAWAQDLHRPETSISPGESHDMAFKTLIKKGLARQLR
jgi:hypothetical protein